MTLKRLTVAQEQFSLSVFIIIDEVTLIFHPKLIYVIPISIVERVV